MKLKDKVIVLTGASSGIGKSAAIKFAQDGGTVIALARRQDKLVELEEETKDLPGLVDGVALDVTDDAKVDEMIKYVLDKYGKIDVLVNNAGVLDDYKSVTNVTDEIWDRCFDVNVTGPMKLIRKILPIMLEQETKGNILNTASVGGLYGGRGGVSYVASKHAVVGMTKNIAITYADQGIRCNAIAPGSIKTEIGTKVGDPDMSVLQKLMKGVDVLPALAEPEEIANVMAFIISDEASFMNGSIVVADGGWTSF
ncbi:MAG: SDR family oxidoreductase [Tissierellia bacterium]|nr:SDR family oxidoreductase [Tissierellia bacterium]